MIALIYSLVAVPAIITIIHIFCCYSDATHKYPLPMYFTMALWWAILSAYSLSPNTQWESEMWLGYTAVQFFTMGIGYIIMIVIIWLGQKEFSYIKSGLFATPTQEYMSWVREQTKKEMTNSAVQEEVKRLALAEFQQKMKFEGYQPVTGNLTDPPRIK